MQKEKGKKKIHFSNLLLWLSWNQVQPFFMTWCAYFAMLVQQQQQKYEDNGVIFLAARYKLAGWLARLARASSFGWELSAYIMIAFKYSHWEKTFINILVVANQNGQDVSFGHKIFLRANSALAIVKKNWISPFKPSVVSREVSQEGDTCSITLVLHIQKLFFIVSSVIMHQCYAFPRLSLWRCSSVIPYIMWSSAGSDGIF